VERLAGWYVDLEHYKGLKEAQALLLSWWDLNFCRGSVNGVNATFHFFIENFLHIFGTALNFEVLKWVSASGREYLYCGSAVEGMFEHLFEFII